jgi:hypothetical protein
MPDPLTRFRDREATITVYFGATDLVVQRGMNIPSAGRVVWIGTEKRIASAFSRSWKLMVGG